MNGISRTQDLEATHFAMCLLMPEPMVIKHFREMFPNGISLTTEDNPIEKLADLFQVTTTMMWIRLGQLKMIPAV